MGALDGAEASGDLHLDLHHAPALFGNVVGEGDGRVVEETQDGVLMIAQADDEVVAWAPLRPPALLLAGRVQGWLRLVEGEPFGDDASVSGREDGDEGRTGLPRA